MAKTMIKLDDQLVADVARVLGTGTKSETVNGAMREVLETRRRALALIRLQELVTDGATDIDIDILMNKRTYRR